MMAFKNRCLKITCFTGLVWLTDGLGGEHVLGSGQQVQSQTSGKTSIQAFAPSRLEINGQPPKKDQGAIASPRCGPRFGMIRRSPG